MANLPRQKHFLPELRVKLRTTTQKSTLIKRVSTQILSMPPCKVLISNDDGIDAPGLRALTAALVAADIFDLYVCAPSGER